MEKKTNSTWIVDDVQRVVELHQDGLKNLPNGNIEIQKPNSHKGQIYKPEFLYDNEDQAHQEVADRHFRLNRAFENKDMLSCLSINKEPSRKSEGFSQKELDLEKIQDKKQYAYWKENLKERWREINQEEPDMEKLSKTLRNSQLIKEVLAEPLAPDFIEILTRESAQEKRKNLGEKTPSEKRMEARHAKKL